MANLVIVESPTKVGAIKKYLGSNYKVVASKGHLRDLPKSTLGVDIENGFEPHYINIRGKGDLIKEIKKEAKNAKKVFLATDPDREGEAIAWHLANVLGIPVEKTLRVSFNEITPTVVKASIKEPRNIDMNLVNAQQTRRLLDRIVGYKISPLLWKTVKSGLSAGRVQSVATRILVERENEIAAFVPVEYWTIEAELQNADGKSFTVRFYGDENGKLKLSNEADAQAVLNAINKGEFTVQSVKRAEKQKLPAPPFTTSTLQQEASYKLGFQSARTMRVAQELYEGINVGSEHGGVQGLITYMRTDSLRISDEAQSAAKEFIVEKYGEEYAPKTPRKFKAAKSAQDAHEAIRPSKVELTPALIRKALTPDQYKLYKLIWERFVASQMQSAKLNTVTADFINNGYIFRASGYSVAFPGYMMVYEATEEVKESSDDVALVKDIRIPTLNDGEKLSMLSVAPEQHFTEAPPRYTEASLIKFLEEKGIGRPSTYTPIITTILARNYVHREGKALVPTQLGILTTKLMEENFADVVDYKFTANMETDLDKIEEGKLQYLEVLADFWKDFKVDLAKAEEKIGSEDIKVPVEETDIICDKCGAKMVVRMGKFGKFAACPNFPKCRNTKPLTPPEEQQVEEKKEPKKEIVADFKCEKCGSDMVLRTSRYGSFYACSKYPACKSIKPLMKEIDVPCPKCGGKVLTKYGKKKTVFYSCENYPKCDFSSWDMPTAEICPDCGKMLFRKKGKDLLICADKECGYKVACEPLKEQDE